VAGILFIIMSLVFEILKWIFIVTGICFWLFVVLLAIGQKHIDFDWKKNAKFK